MDNRIKSEGSNDIVLKMLDNVDEMERALKSFKNSTVMFREKLDDEVSRSATELVEHISKQINDLRVEIEKRLNIVSKGMERFTQIETNRPRRINKI